MVRAWSLVRLALRNASTLGLHLKVVDTVLSPAQLRERARTWYALYGLEVAMSEVLGRPPSVSLVHTAIPLDLLETDPNADGCGQPNELGTRSSD